MHVENEGYAESLKILTLVGFEPTVSKQVSYQVSSIVAITGVTRTDALLPLQLVELQKYGILSELLKQQA